VPLTALQRAAGYDHVDAAFLGRRPDGFFLYGRRHTPGAVRLLRSAGIPIVESGDLAGRPIDMVVSYSNFDAAKAMTNHLIRKGYRRIAMVCASRRESERHFERWRGYRAALREQGMAYSARQVMEKTVLGIDQGAEALTALLDRNSRIDAILFTSDVMAIGALLECQRREWRVPDRVAIAGFDDQEIAGQILLDRLNGRGIAPKVVNVAFQLMDRESA